MDFNTILNTVKEYVPIPVIVAVAAVIMLVYGSMYIASIIEEAVEAKTGKQIKIFDHKKIWLSVFWCAVVSVALALAGFIAWREAVYYGLLILGASTFLYEAFLKKIGIKKEDAN
jgi:4-hydroxybenzoate polyprenyltransferase